ncbi:hypothetical protein IFM89_002641 [Coptis chinensis]|uniref:Uncharacterized protein n=1 Tax=Coptis chinensis TaxID=261450 RepID=A0A835M3Z0_9MAGN|nr:hypothetical protein IFM89_002641 [Coptis chinensis]
MRDFPSCFGESGVQIADSSSSSSSSNKNAQNIVTCVHRTKLRGRACLITVTWSKNLMGQGLTIGIDDSRNQCLCKVDVKPWLFSKRKGSKSLEAESSKVDIYWDLSSAKFGSGPEPLEGFYLAIVFDHEMVLQLGDMRKEAYKKTNALPLPTNSIFIAKREHIYGKRVFGTKAQFCDNGQIHSITIECDTIGPSDPCLLIHVDSKRAMQVKRLKWKFRGNQTILVDGLAVEVFWDVYNWLFGTTPGNAVFMFQSCLSAEKSLCSQVPSDTPVLPWSCSQIFQESQLQGAQNIKADGIVISITSSGLIFALHNFVPGVWGYFSKLQSLKTAEDRDYRDPKKFTLRVMSTRWMENWPMLLTRESSSNNGSKLEDIQQKLLSLFSSKKQIEIDSINEEDNTNEQLTVMGKMYGGYPTVLTDLGEELHRIWQTKGTISMDLVSPEHVKLVSYTFSSTGPNVNPARVVVDMDLGLNELATSGEAQRINFGEALLSPSITLSHNTHESPEQVEAATQPTQNPRSVLELHATIIPFTVDDGN